MIESEILELKSHFLWGHAGQEFDVLKTLVAFANTRGGTIVLERVAGEQSRLDSARIDDFVNKYIRPRILGIVSVGNRDGRWEISVPRSIFAPHVFVQEASFTVGNKMKSAFYPGQVYVRHSSKSEPASAEDLQKLIMEGVSSWLTSLGTAVGKIAVGKGGTDAIPVRLAEGGPALSVSIGETHPYSATALGEELGKNAAWIGAAINKLGFRNRPELVVRVPGFRTNFYLQTGT